MKKFAAIVEARMGSTRLPGKIFYKANNKTFLWHLINRLKQVKQINQIILATTTNKNDDVLKIFANKNKINYFRGSEINVKKRVLDAAKKFNVKNIVSITADCPVLDINLISQVIDVYKIHEVDFVTNSDLRSYPDGMDVSIFSTKTLQKSYRLTKSDYYREHTTLFIKHNKKIFKQINIVAPKNIYYPQLGLTLDEYEDYVFLKKIIEYFMSKKNYFFSCDEIIKLLKKKKNWLKINSRITRKVVKYKC